MTPMWPRKGFGTEKSVMRLGALRLRIRLTDSTQVLHRQDDSPRQGEPDRDDEEEEAGRNRLLLLHAELAEEADEEGLAYRDPVHRKRHEEDEEEQRPHHVVRPRREVDADGLPAHPDREHAHGLHDERQQEDPHDQPDVAAEVVHALVERAQRTLELDTPQQRYETAQQAAHAVREEQHREHDRPAHENRLDSMVRTAASPSQRRG